MKKTILFLLLLLPNLVFADNDDACELYLCLMGKSTTDGGEDCPTVISTYTAKFNGSCPNLPTCKGSFGPGTYGVVMTSASGSGGSVPERGETKQIVQVCVEADGVCAITLSAPALTEDATGGGEATCGAG